MVLRRYRHNNSSIARCDHYIRAKGFSRLEYSAKNSLGWCRARSRCVKSAVEFFEARVKVN